MALTRLEERTLRYVSRYIAEHGYAPTLQETAAGLRLKSRGTVHRYVTSLVRKGYLSRTGKGWRGIRVSTEYAPQLTVLPVAGRIVPGRPVEAVAETPEINLSELLMGPDRVVYMVRGYGMADAGILEGDLIVVRKTARAENGDTVVAVIDNDETVLRRLRTHGNRIEMISSDRSLASMIYPAERVHIKGVVVGVVRPYPAPEPPRARRH